jgi:hypothetical protein
MLRQKQEPVNTGIFVYSIKINVHVRSSKLTRLREQYVTLV